MNPLEIAELAMTTGVLFLEKADKDLLLAVDCFRTMFDAFPVYFDDTNYEVLAWEQALELSTTPLPVHSANYSWEQLSESGLAEPDLRKYLQSLFGYQRLGVIEFKDNSTTYMYVASFIAEPKLELFRPASNGVPHQSIGGEDLIKELRTHLNVGTDLRQGAMFDV